MSAIRQPAVAVAPQQVEPAARRRLPVALRFGLLFATAAVAGFCVILLLLLPRQIPVPIAPSGQPSVSSQHAGH